MLIPAIHIQASLKGATWSDTRSEGDTPTTPFWEEGELVQWNSQWINDGQALSSTSSGTLQPPYPRFPVAEPPCTTSTTPVIEAGGMEDAGPSGESEDKPMTWNAVRQGEDSVPVSTLPQSFDHAPVQPGNTSTRLAKLLEEVRHLQQEVRGKRSRARDLRRALRNKREEEDYLRLVLREKLSWISPEALYQQTTAINKAIDDLKAATELYRILENDYHRIEDELDQREKILDKRLGRLNGLLRKQAAPGTKQTESVGSGSDFSSEPASAPASDADRLTSNAAAYITLVGNVRLLRERLYELESEYKNLVDQENIRQRIGLSLAPEALAFLANYETTRMKTQTGLDFAIRRLVAHPEHKHHPEAVVLDEEWGQVAQDFRPGSPADNQAPRDPLQMTEFEDRSPFFEERRPVPLNKFTFVNRWLLHQLRHSSFQVLQYKSNPEFVHLADEGWDGDDISQMALMLWYRDETTGLVPVRNDIVE